MNLYFWKNWKPTEKLLSVLLLSSLIFALGTYGWTLWKGEQNVFEWTTEGELTRVPLQVDSFEHIFFPFVAEVDGFLLTETFSTSWFQLNHTAAYGFALLVALGWVCILTASTYMKTLWYGGVMLGFAFFLSFCNIDGLAKLEGLMQLEQEKKWFLITLVPFALLTFGLRFLSKVSVMLRFVLIAGLMSGVSYFLYSEINTLDNPVFYISNYGIVVPIFLTVAFLIFNGHEIPRGLYWLVARSGNGMGSVMMHFVIVMALFFAQTIYAYLVHTNYIDWGLVYVPAFVLFIFMTVLSIWGFLGRETHYKNFFEAAPTGLLLIVGWALIAVATVAFAIGTQNDPLLRFLEKIILYANLGFTFAFVIYAFINFSELLEQGHPNTYAQLWHPRKLSWTFAGLAAAFVMMILFYKDNGTYFYNQLQAAYLNGRADVYLSEADALKTKSQKTNGEIDEELDKKARETYQLSKIYYQDAVYKIYTNHKGYWGLGSISLRNYYWQEAYTYLKIASERTASPYTYSKVADLLIRKNELDEAYETLVKGVAEFPESAELKNNLILSFIAQYGTAYNDSLSNQLLNVEKYSYLPEAIETNWWAVKTLTDAYSDTDSLEKLIKTRQNTGALSNKIIYHKRFPNQAISFFDAQLVKDSVWSTEDLLYAYHYALLKPQKGDTTIMNLFKNREQVLQNQDNIAFILLAKAIEQYHTGDVYSAFRTIDYLEKAYGNQSAQYKHILGLWHLEHEQYSEAQGYFSKAYFMGGGLNNLYQAISLSELKDKTRALEMWRGWDTTQNHPFQPTAHEMYCILQADCAKMIDFTSLDDDAKRRYLHYQIPNLDTDEFAQKMRSMSNQNLKLEVVLDRIKFHLDSNDVENALIWREAATQLNAEKLEIKTLERFQLLDMKLLWKTGKLLSLKSLLDVTQPARAYGKSKKLFYEALYAENIGDTLRAAACMQKAVAGLPFDFDVLEEAITFYRRNQKDKNAYNVALQLLETYPYHPKAHALYAYEALNMGADNYAEQSKEFLRLNAPITYQKFLPKYDSLKREKELMVERWLNGE